MKTNVIENVKQKVGVAYIRESTEEQDKGYSPDNQLNTIKRYANEHHIKVTETYKDLITGTSASKRDDFQRMITDAMQKKFEVILVFHTSRFARNVEEARQYKNLLRKKCGIQVIFVTQQFGDDEDPSSFLNEGVNELFDEYYSRNLSFWVKSNLMEKRRQGYQNGSVPFGYYKKQLGFDKEKGRKIYGKDWIIDKREAEIVRKIFNWYATGQYSLPDIAEKVNKLGAKTKNGNPFTYSSLKDMLHNRVYLGYVCSPRHKNYPELPGNHQRIISDKLFNKVKQAFRERTNTFGRPVAQHRFYLLQGLLYCYNCPRKYRDIGKSEHFALLPRMYAQNFKWKQREYTAYSCKLKKENRSCIQKSVKCSVIDDQILAVMMNFDIPQDIRPLVLTKLEELLRKSAAKPRDEQMLEKLEKQKKKLMVIFTKTDQLSEDQYLDKLRVIEEQMSQYEGVQMGLDVTPVKISEYLKQTEHFLQDFSKFWAVMADYDKRTWIQTTTQRIWVKNDKIVGLEPTERFKPLFVTQMLVSGQAPSSTPN